MPARADALPAPGQTRLVLPAARYMRATAHGELSQVVHETFCWVHREWLPTSGLEAAGGPELEWYDHRAHSGSDAEVDILVPVK